ncbi:hypothetical protein P7K49_012651 [Saguinus oedipus]|uniref:Aminopeptidase N n=1 Tax=Saguinus oedipus TaxID=9490 RepID=A0ABQ9VDN8_SAGOE|nr:hypothetical protein P7K49_012651 [Saguinus oedipus]
MRLCSSCPSHVPGAPHAHKVPVTLALNNTLFLIDETEYMPWEAALSSLSYFKLMFDRSEVYGPMKGDVDSQLQLLPLCQAWHISLSALPSCLHCADLASAVASPINYLKKQVTPLFFHFGNITNNWTVIPENLMDQYSEINAISTACSNGVLECQQMVSDFFKQWMANTNNNPIHPNLRSTVYCNAIAQGGEEEWNFAWEQFRSATLVSEADKLRAALACSNQVWILNREEEPSGGRLSSQQAEVTCGLGQSRFSPQSPELAVADSASGLLRYLSYTLNPDLIRKQDATSTIISIANNVVGQTLVWDFVQSNWKKLFNDYGGGSFSFSNLIQGVTRRFSTEYELQQLEQFKKNNEDVGFGSGTRALEQALEKTRANIKWVTENKEAVLRWFTENSK